MAKRKAKKVKKTIDPATQDKIEKMQQLLQAFKYQAAEYENYLNSECEMQCARIEKLYSDKLKSIPESMRNMTIYEIMKLKEKESVRETECPTDERAYRMQHERLKMTSEKKRTQRNEKKRSVSAQPYARGMSIAQYPVSNNVSQLNQSLLTTPIKQSRKPCMTVTPKFNVKLPVRMARKPKPGEVLMSLTGSPLQNFMDDLPSDKPATKITLSLGQGKVITLNGNDEIKPGNKFLDNIDEPLKITIQNVQRQLEEILKA